MAKEDDWKWKIPGSVEIDEDEEEYLRRCPICYVVYDEGPNCDCVLKEEEGEP